MILTKLYREFFNSEKAGGLILILMTIISLVIANSAWGPTYIDFWNKDVVGHSMLHWINDGLMTIFFLLIGLELEREIYEGELSTLKNASLPIFAAIGGMVVPATIFLIFNFGTETQAGAGIPMATDIAFAIGILSLLGSRVPASMKIFLTALAVIDDLGAIIIIAVFYTDSFSAFYLLSALTVFVLLLVLNKYKVLSLIPYLAGGVLMWFLMSKSGVHATITGVLLAFAIPFGDDKEKSPSFLLQHMLHIPVAFFIIPLFALANTCIMIDKGIFSELSGNLGTGIIMGLFAGKPLGIWLFSLIGVSLGLCSLPSDLRWRNVIGLGFLGGIGFTMSIFISLLAFDNAEIITISKLAVFTASLLSGIAGFIILFISLRNRKVANPEI